MYYVYRAEAYVFLGNTTVLHEQGGKVKVWAGHVLTLWKFIRVNSHIGLGMEICDRHWIPTQRRVKLCLKSTTR